MNWADMAVVGRIARPHGIRGQVILNGAGTGEDGTYSVNGAPSADVPDYSQFALSASSP